MGGVEVETCSRVPQHRFLSLASRVRRTACDALLILQWVVCCASCVAAPYHTTHVSTRFDTVRTCLRR